MPVEFKDWLRGKFLEWEKGTGKRQSYSAFARYLGVKQSTVSQWLSGNYPPSRENVKLLAQKLGYDVYIALGLVRPDRQLRELQAYYDAVPEDKREGLLRVVKDYVRSVREHRNK